ncbi:MAG: CNNM domain-containing protein, partial [Fibrobacterota bacterium]|nr:CNNM domain-containing protein [Chitinispirillaceae bacterium]
TLLFILLGNVFVNISLTGFIHKLISEFFHLESEIVTLFVATGGIVLFGEILPKTIALKNNEFIAHVVALPLQVFVRMTTPVLSFIQDVNSFFIKKYRIYFRDPDPFVTVNELRSAVAKSYKDGAITQDEAGFIERILERGPEPARKYMMHRSTVQAFDETQTVADALEQMAQCGDIVAIVRDSSNRSHVRGLIRLSKIFSAQPADLLVLHCEEPVWAPESSEVAELVSFLFSCGSPDACMLDEYGDFSGLFVAQNAIDSMFMHLFTKPEKSHTRSVGVTLNGSDDCSVLSAFLSGSSQLDVGQWRTVNGVLTNYLGRIPKTGETFAVGGSKFYIISAGPTKIDRVLIQKDGNDDN